MQPLPCKALVVSGSRSIHDQELFDRLACQFKPKLILHGGASGVDTLGARYADQHTIPQQIFIPDWAQHGKAAGPIRNREMVEQADALLCLWDGESRGTLSTLEYARVKKIPILLYRTDTDEEKWENRLESTLGSFIVGLLRQELQSTKLKGIPLTPGEADVEEFLDHGGEAIVKAICTGFPGGTERNP